MHLSAFPLTKGLVITGTDGKKRAEIPDRKDRKYLICATQLVYNRILKELNREVQYKNTWRTPSDEIRDDLKDKRVITAEDFSYLDNRFRVLTDIRLSNFYDHSVISGGENPDIPPGMPTNTYHKGGLEDKVDLLSTTKTTK